MTAGVASRDTGKRVHHLAEKRITLGKALLAWSQDNLCAIDQLAAGQYHKIKVL